MSRLYVNWIVVARRVAISESDEYQLQFDLIYGRKLKPENSDEKLSEIEWNLYIATGIFFPYRTYN